MKTIGKKLTIVVVMSLLVLMGPLTGLASQDKMDSVDVDDRWMSHEKLRENLYQIEKDSSGKVQVDVVGHSYQGREIYAARVGTGDQVLLINGNIHGNEKSGPEALIQMFRTLGTSDSSLAQSVREGVTIVAIPRLNVDGTEITQRQNIFPWTVVMKAFPKLVGAMPPWYYHERNGGFDINRDFHPNVSYEPVPEDLPGTGADFGFFLTNESRILRDVYLDLKAEFGVVEAFVDIHHMGTPQMIETGEDVTMAIDYPPLGPEDNPKYAAWPKLNQDRSRKYALAAALGVKEFSDKEESVVARYIHPEERDLPGQARSSFALNGTSTVLFEMPGQQPRFGYDQELIDRVENGLWGIASRMADHSINRLNGDDFLKLPKYWTSHVSDMLALVERYAKEGEITGDEAARSLKTHLIAVNHYEEKEQANKVVKHMKGFKLLLAQQKESGFISDAVYNRLMSDSNYLIEKWQQ